MLRGSSDSAAAKRSTLSCRAGSAAGSGARDALESEGLPPSARAPPLPPRGLESLCQGSCARAQIPTASYRRSRSRRSQGLHGPRRPDVVKADGLAAGKGVVVARDLDGACRAVDAALVERRFGAAGEEIIVEDFLAGEEASFLACRRQGRAAARLGAGLQACRRRNTGPNTGGMGAISPSPRLTPALEGAVMERIVLPAVAAMSRAGCRSRASSMPG